MNQWTSASRYSLEAFSVTLMVRRVGSELSRTTQSASVVAWTTVSLASYGMEVWSAAFLKAMSWGEKDFTMMPNWWTMVLPSASPDFISTTA